MTRLFLCEKYLQACDIADVLGAGRKGAGCFFGDGVTVTWCIGHMLEMAPPDAYGEQYKRWEMESLPILPDVWLMAPKRDRAKQLKAIRDALGNAGEVVIATDADREGETIAREILHLFSWRGPLKRLWLSALNDASIRMALANLLPGERKESLYQAGLARSRADWLVGMNLTRAYTVLGRQSGHQGVLSVGRVQTPTLRLVVDRDREIEAFVPKDYWEVIATCQAPDGDASFAAKWLPGDDVADPEGRCLSEQTARNLAQRIEGRRGRVTEAKTKRVKEAPPLLLDLGTLQQEASRRWGMGAKEVLDTAQALYETHKATTYPRTDCPYLPVSMLDEVSQVLDALQQSDGRIAALIQQADTDQRSRAWNDAKITAHHAIIPTTAACDVGRMSESEFRVYDLIRRRYLAQFYPHHEYDATTVDLDIAGEAFRATGRCVRVPGWRVLFGREKKDAESQALPAIKSGDDCKVLQGEAKACQTKPPARFTEGTLIAAMKQAAKWVTDPKLKAMLKETAGLGTEATRASIIQTLLERSFIEKRKKFLVSTDAARALIDALPEPVKDPATTALWEQALDDIAQGHGELDGFLSRQAEWVRQLVERARQGNGVAIKAGAGQSQHACPDCGKPLQRRKGKKGFFWGCSGYPDCKTTLPDQRGKPGQRISREPVGACACGGEVRESHKAWACESCKATVWKEVSGKRLDAETAISLLGGKTVRLSGLKSRKGKRYTASARMVDGKVKLIFDQAPEVRTAPATNS